MSSSARRSPVVVVAVGALLALAGCGPSTSSSGPGSGTQEDATAPATEEAAEPAPPEESATADEPAPAGTGPLDFSATTVAGDEVDVAALVGDRPAVLWFWAPWCVICRSEAPEFVGVEDVRGEEVVFLGVAGLGPVEEMEEFVEATHTAGFEHLADHDGAIWARFGVTSQPAIAFISADGEVEVVPGTISSRELAERVDALAAG